MPLIIKSQIQIQIPNRLSKFLAQTEITIITKQTVGRGPFHIMPEKFQNAALFLRLGLSPIIFPLSRSGRAER